MLTVYTSPESLYCAKLRVGLRHKRLDWQETEPSDGCGSEDYQARVPSGTLPALLDGDLLLADSEAILEYLDEQYPEPALLPGTPAERAQARERARFHDTRLEPALRAFFPYVKPEQQHADALPRLCDMLNLRLDQFGRLLELSPVLWGKGLTIGDCGFPITFAWIDVFSHPLSLDVVWPEPVTAYRTWLAEQPAVEAELAAYRPHMMDWVNGRGVL
ncbi:glutathione S-transferase family protein [Coralliovum pocilloporae]|uniref:glutathione S-transferase family protein n=1 Tax=Coralliovum pocilloporae TaxID=3066369 RepID=UPI0033071F08